MKPLRIAILTPTFLPKCSGAEVFHHNLATRLAAGGHAVTVLAPRSCVRKLREQGWSLPYAVESYPDKRWGWLKRNQTFAFWLNRRALTALQRRHRFDIWHAFVLHPVGVVLADWQKHSRVPGLVRAVGDDVSGLPSHRHGSHVARALREKLPSAGALVALSQEMSDELVALGVAREKIRILPNAVATERFVPSPAARAAARSELGIPEDAFLFLCVARNHPQKDFPTLLAAFQKLSKIRETHLVIAGRGARDLDVRAIPRIHLREFGAEKPERGVPSMPPQKLVDLYRAADAFVISSLLEGFSSAILEAMAAGLPVVATNAPGICGVVTSGREGLLVPLRSPDALEAAMRNILEDAPLRERMADEARATAARYSWPSVVAGYESLYRELIAAQKIP